MSQVFATPTSVYAGFDPTADSLHVGNLLVMMVLAHFQRHGHRPICVVRWTVAGDPPGEHVGIELCCCLLNCVADHIISRMSSSPCPVGVARGCCGCASPSHCMQVGGATGLIGDPSGRSTERTMLTPHDMERNVSGISRNLSSFLKFSNSHAAQSVSSPSPISDALLLNNYDWHRGVSAIEFLRDIGKHFRIGVMLSKDSVKKYVLSSVYVTDGARDVKPQAVHTFVCVCVCVCVLLT
jgi:tyrosyl-tRNA synthetase